MFPRLNHLGYRYEGSSDLRYLTAELQLYACWALGRCHQRLGLPFVVNEGPSSRLKFLSRAAACTFHDLEAWKIYAVGRMDA